MSDFTPMVHRFQNAVSATGNGNALVCVGFGSVVFQVLGTFTATITFEGSVDGANWSALSASLIGGGSSSTTATAAGIYVASCAGLQEVRARVTWTSGTSVTVLGSLSDAGGGASTGGSLPGTLGQTTMSASLPVVIASDQTDLLVEGQPTENHLGSVGSNTVQVYVNPTVTAGAYAAGDVVGGEITLTNFMRISGGSARMLGITLVDVSNSGPTLDILLFDQAPTAALNDNDAYAWNASDYAKLVMHFRVDASEWTTVGSKKVCSKALSVFPLLASGSANLYLYMVTLNAVTFAATTDLHVRFGPDRD